MKEIWKDIKGYEGLYQVSNLGRVKSLGRNQTIGDKTTYFKEEKILIGSKNHKGYWYVGLYKDGKGKRKAIHRLVAEHFIPNPENKPCVNHKDEVKTNNCVDNLEWLTHKENTNYGTCIERRVKHTDWNTHNDSKKKKVYQYDKELNLVKIWSSTCECEREGFSQACVSRCCRKERYSYRGFYWSFSELSEKEKQEVASQNISFKIIKGHLDSSPKKVYQYDNNLNLIKVYESTVECAMHGFSQGHVASCCRGERKTHKGFVWSYCELDKNSIYNKFHNKEKPQSKIVYQYDKDLNLINTWSSASECETHGFTRSKISNCCRGKSKTHKGYIWSYALLN